VKRLPETTGQQREAARKELLLLDQQTREARNAPSRLQDDVKEAEVLPQQHETCYLVKADQHLSQAALHARSDAEALDLAELDELTGLVNRRLLMERLTLGIAAAKLRGEGLALLLIDLNGLKQISDTLGHSVGDQVLREVAHCLVSCVREVDTVSRYGGDEFLIFLDEITQRAYPRVVADKIIAALGTPRRIGEHMLHLTASIGISLYPEDGLAPHTLIDHADAAMCHAKRYGMAVAVHYDPQLPPAETPMPAPEPSLVRYDEALAQHEQRHTQLREANEQLVLAALNAQELQRAAEQAQRQQEHFLAIVAHELRNPLTPLSMTAGLLMLVRKEELPRMQTIIERQVQHISRLIDDLLDVSRANTGKLRLIRRLTDLSGIIREAVNSCRPAMDLHMQRFDAHLPADALYIDGDAVRLTQVFSNLLGNASKYTPDGGSIELSVERLDENVAIRLQDSGIGILAEALPFIFDPFVQDARAVGFNGAGLGIGLTVVRELVEAHGGNVVASSAGDGLGSRFVVTLPLVKAPANA
jgi:diguanylate cyclase (GGDEF)-like protein